MIVEITEFSNKSYDSRNYRVLAKIKYLHNVLLTFSLPNNLNEILTLQ